MGSITFKLKASRHIGTVDINGSLTTCKEAEQLIADKLKLPLDEIQIFLAGSESLLHPEDKITENAVVDVVRHVGSGKAAKQHKNENQPLPDASAFTSHSAGAMLTEEERLAQLQEDVSLDTGINEVSRGRGRGRGAASRGMFLRAGYEESLRPPPKGYICHNCGKGGHLIHHCPSARSGNTTKMLSLPVGIPESMLVPCTLEDPAPKFITRDNRIVKRKVMTSMFTSVLSAPDATGSSHAKCNRSSAEDNSVRCCKCGGVVSIAFKLSCCQQYLCDSCFHQMAEEALALDDVSPDDFACPHCSLPIQMDEVQEVDLSTVSSDERGKKVCRTE